MPDDLPRRYVECSWIPVGVGFEGEAINVNGINPWNYKWRSLRIPLTLPHPAYPSQQNDYRVYQVDTENGIVVFASGELSPNVWGFYLPANDNSEV